METLQATTRTNGQAALDAGAVQSFAETLRGPLLQPGDAEGITAWAQDYWEALHPYSAGGAYLNFMMEEGDERIRATYRDNYDRLTNIKAQYDPENLFRVNQNVAPAM